MKRSIFFSLMIASVLVLSGCAASKDETTLESPADQTSVERTDPTLTQEEQILLDRRLLESSAEDQSQTPASTPTAEGSGSVVGDGEKVEIVMQNFQFSQSEIRVRSGAMIIIQLRSIDGSHDMVIDELGVKSKQLAAGESEQVEIKIPSDAAGSEYEFYCSVGTHRQNGMVGKLIIE